MKLLPITEKAQCADAQLGILCRNGLLDTALHVLWCLPTAPSEGVYVLLLKACTEQKALQHARLVHAHLLTHFTPNVSVFLLQHLLVTLAKCGALEDAHGVLLALPFRTVFSWTALISGFVACGKAHDALHHYKCMQDDGVKPNCYTFVSLFKACAIIADIKQGKKLHDDFKKTGMSPNVYIVNTLVSMYGKCGHITEAENVFKSGHVQLDVVSWNAMLSSYVEQEEGRKALQGFRQMHVEGVSLDERSYLTALLACNHINEQDQVIVEGQLMKVTPSDVCQSLHSDAQRNGFIAYDFLVTTLIYMYGKFKRLSNAESLFCQIHNPDIVQWNAMLTAYSELGLAVQVLQLYAQLHKEGVMPDEHTFVIALQVCCVLDEIEGAPQREAGSTMLMALEVGEALRMDAWKHGCSSNVFLNNTLISLYGKCGNIAQAEEIFQQIDNKEEVSWNAMLSAYVEQGKVEKALQLFSAMQKEDVSPTNVTFVVAIQACSILAVRGAMGGEITNLTCLEIGQALYDDVQREGFATDVVVANTLVHMYGKCGMISEAEAVFEELSQRNGVSWNAMITALVEHGLGVKASQLFWKMQESGTAIDVSTLISVLQASNITGWAEISKNIHFFAVAEGLDVNFSLSTTLIHAYGNCALIADTHAIFDGLSKFDVILCSAYLDALAQDGDCVECLQMFELMQWKGFEPDDVTFYSILSGCSHAGFVNTGVQCFQSMIEFCGLGPGLKHYAVMLDLLGRAGDFKRVENMLARMQPDLGTWSSLLGVCRLHGNVEMAEQAFDHLVRLKPTEASAYVLMCNIFADAGMHDSAKQIDILRQRQGLEAVCFECEDM